MLEYLDPVALPLLDHKAPRYQWRKRLRRNEYNVYDRVLYYDRQRMKEWDGVDILAISHAYENWALNYYC